MVTLSVVVALLLVVLIVLQTVSLLRPQGTDLSALDPAFHSMERSNERTERSMRDELGKNRTELLASSRQGREELNQSVKAIGDTLHNRLTSLTQANDQKLERIRSTVEQRLQTLQQENCKSLEGMRQTVDEKLQGTLNKRLGESFKLISERLEKVHHGLGEMQTLASGVGDLKRVLTNVKTRGTWGEIQLGALLRQMLAGKQYDTNVDTTGTGARVEFVINLPGPAGNSDAPVWLPIDSKFPLADYQRLLSAHEAADQDAAAAALKNLEVSIKTNAATIARKYLAPPQTTDFAIMFLPIEGLYAEVAQRNELVEQIQRDYRVVIAGPTTLAALLNSLQMGFRTLAIQERSSEAWQILSAVKAEFGKFGGVLDKLQKKLKEASKTIDTASVRTRAIERKLRDVEEAPHTEVRQALKLEDNEASDTDTLSV